MLTCLESNQQMWLKSNSIKTYGLVTRTKNTGKEIKAIVLKINTATFPLSSICAVSEPVRKSFTLNLLEKTTQGNVNLKINHNQRK